MEPVEHREAQRNDHGPDTEEERNKIKRNLAKKWDMSLGIDDLIMRMTSAQMFFSMILSNLSKEICINAGNESIRRTGLFLDKYKG